MSDLDVIEAKKEAILSLSVDDTFFMKDHYIDNELKAHYHDFECHIMAVIIDDNEFKGLTIKRLIPSNKEWKYEFFDALKMLRENIRITGEKVNASKVCK